MGKVRLREGVGEVRLRVRIKRSSSHAVQTLMCPVCLTGVQDSIPMVLTPVYNIKFSGQNPAQALNHLATCTDVNEQKFKAG